LNYSIGGAAQANNSFTNLGSGNYTITVSDANGCTVTSTQSISAPNAPIFSTATATNVDCNGGTSGSISSTATGGQGAITYNLQPTNQSNATGTFTNLSANSYTITATDQAGCSVQTIVVVTEPTQVQWTTTSSTNITCNGGNDGSITTTASGGTGQITYTLQPTNQSNTSGSFTTLAANTYTITATDMNGCTITTTLTITAPTAIQWTSASATNVTCNNASNGTITTTASGGTGQITYTVQPTNQNNINGSFSVLGPNTYTITATDINGCSITTTLVITQPTPLTITSIAATQPTCVPGNDGSLTITASGGTTTYQYSNNGSALQNNNSFTNLGSGTYTITVSDANGCTVTSTQSISAPNAPIITNLVATDASCDPGGDGTVTVSASSGTTPYTYSSNGITFQASSLLTGLSATTYTIQVTDAIGCTGTSTIQINTPPSPIVALVSSTDASCIPGCDGTMTLSASGGTSLVYTYSLNGGVYQASNAFANLCAGTYTVTVKDGNGCTGTITVQINTTNGPTIATSTSTDVLCNGGNTGSLAITLSGGIGTITYTLLPGNTTNTIGQFGTLTANTYTVNASDVNGCTVSTIITVNEPQLLQFTNVTPIGSLCNGSSNGSIDVSTIGGTPTITYTITPSATFTPPSSFTNLVGNTSYTVQATDANGCTLTSAVFVSQPQALSFTTTQATDASCNGLADGSIATVASGGTGLLTYTLQPVSQTNTTGSFTGLNAFTYTVTVTDVNNCTLTTTLQIQEPTAITQVSLTTQDETCNNSGNGSISISCAGGTGILNYNLQPTNQTNTTGNYPNISGNTYTITVTDANNCSYTTSVQIMNPLPVTYVSTTWSNILCHGDSTGIISVQATGGTGASYSYTMQPTNQTNATGLYNNLIAGGYTITASDVNQCTVTTIVTITEPTQLIGAFVSKQDLTCHNSNNGVINVTASGGVQPYTFTLQPGGASNGNGTFTGLAGGMYSVYVTDSNQCVSAILNIEVTNPSLILFTQASSQDITCYGANTGAITVTASGGIGTIAYSILPSIGNQIGVGQFNNLTAGIYTVIATDANNCSATTLVQVNQNPQIIINQLLYTEPICWGDMNGSIDVSANGGVGSLTYQLNIGTPQSNGYFNNLLSGSYLITVRDSLNCQIDSIFILTEPERVHASSLEILPVYCIGASNGKIIVEGAGGRGGYTYYLRPGLMLNKTGMFSNLHEGVYTLTIKDSAGCHFDTVLNVMPPIAPFGITTTKKDLTCFGTGTEGWAEVILSGGEPPYTYLWNTSPIQNTQKAENLNFGYYFVEVTDGNGCIAKDSVYIEPGPCCEQVFIPNAFSPNGDGKNDVFKVTTSAGIELIQFDVYDRWGNRVWSTNDFRSGWDGVYRGADQSMNVFYYIFRYKCLTDGEKYIKKGDILLLR
jgi:gliding motility-associated-like protein